MKTLTKLLLVTSALAVASALPAAEKSDKPAKPRIEVCFVLDTTGSMSGLIEGATPPP